MPGMTANIEIIVTKMDNVLTVPNGVFSFVMNDDLEKQLKAEGITIKHTAASDKKTIWIKQNSSLIETPVDAGFSNGIKTLLTGSVKEADEVVNTIEITTGKKTSGSFFMPSQQNNKSNSE
jgi:hypothetical protein